jgi:arsenate reductase-like glutaredoxin family protein
MGRSIDWYYHRKGDATCAKADAFLAKRGVTAREIVDARKVKVGKPQIAQILRGTHQVIASKGTANVEFNLREEPPVEKILYENLIGPTGSLRAPAIRIGRILVVGFSEDAWTRVLA